MFLVYICISPRCKSLPLERKHDDRTGLVKMLQEDPRSSTCCCTAKYFLWGANLHSLNFESVLEGLWNCLWQQMAWVHPTPTHSVKLPKVEAKIDTDQRHMWSLMVYGKPTQIKSSWVVLVIVSIMVFVVIKVSVGWQCKQFTSTSLEGQAIDA